MPLFGRKKKEEEEEVKKVEIDESKVDSPEIDIELPAEGEENNMGGKKPEPEQAPPRSPSTAPAPSVVTSACNWPWPATTLP